MPAVEDQNQNQQSDGLYHGDNQSPPNLIEVTDNPKPDDASIHWQASEFVMHSKPAWWYAAFIGTAILLGLIFAVLLKDIVAAIAILAVFALTFVMAMRKPRTLSYAVDNSGVVVGERNFPFETFRSFSIIQDGGLDSIFLQPLQRFSLPIIIYFAPEDGEKIVKTLSFHLPHEERDMSLVDKFARTMRF